MSPLPSAAGWPAFVADIGGTHARFGWVDGPGAEVSHVQVQPVAAYPGPAQAAGAYLKGVQALLGTQWRPARRAAWALACPVLGDEVALINGPWRFSAEQLRQSLGLDQLRLLNDFEALAMSLPLLGPGQLRAHGPLPQAKGVLAVVGPGTGLGVGALVQTASGWKPMAGEGGHATLAATDEEEAQLLHLARQRHAHVSAERLLSGSGLPLLHELVCTAAAHTCAPLSAPQIVQAGCEGRDPMCLKTIEVFCAFLGSFAGNVALTLGARGGLYLGGGILPRLGDVFFASRFREKFEAKGRYREYLAGIPTALITDTHAALQGAAAALHGP